VNRANYDRQHAHTMQIPPTAGSLYIRLFPLVRHETGWIQNLYAPPVQAHLPK